MSILDFEIKPEKYDEVTIEEAEAHEEMVSEINYLIAEGFIEIEEDEFGNVRAYPTG